MDWTKAFTEAAPDLITALGSGIVAVSVGAALAVMWNLYQHRRELDLQTADDFHVHYGQFFSVWKVWNQTRASATEAERLVLYDRAAVAEGGMEAILSKISTQKRLSLKMITEMACFRQGFQRLRQSIREKQTLPWNASDDLEYKRFKELTSSVSRIIHRKRWVFPFQAVKNDKAWIMITSNHWEEKWRDPKLCESVARIDA